MKHIKGDLVAGVKSGVILHQVNCKGVMGSGIAKVLKDTYPFIFAEYQALCKIKSFQPDLLLGTAQLCVTGQPDLVVVNMFAQADYGRDAKRYTSYDALDVCLKRVARELKRLGISATDVHHPLIGCGLGGGDWRVVEQLIEVNLGPETTLWTLE